jgi:pSer/pThr/pTyr-binding forkhead associated (FHA) protein
LLVAESISRHATLDPEICLASGSDDPRDLHLTAGRLVSLPDGKTHLVGTAPLTIGRGPSSDIAVHSEDVSRGHAYLLRTPQGFLLVDSSLHGTYVNGERVQAQRLLVDGDVVQVGDRSFRFDLRRVEPSLTGQALAPETSQHPRTVPRDARATGKVGLALALAEQSSWKARMGTWIKRYGPSELAAIALAFGGSWLMRKTTGSAIAAAYGGAIGESLGFYGSLVIREMITEAYFAGARRAPYGAPEMMRTWRGLLLEFGPAELLDTGLLRPLAMGACTTLLGWGPGILVGKLVADLAFYLPVIWVYERRRRKA